MNNCTKYHNDEPRTIYGLHKKMVAKKLKKKNYFAECFKRHLAIIVLCQVPFFGHSENV